MRLGVGRDVLSDCALALVMTAIGVSSVFTTDESVAYDYPPADIRLVLLAIGAGAPIALRRIYPYTAVLLSVSAITPIMALRWNEGVTPLCLLALLYSVAVYRPFRVAVSGLVTVLGMFGFFALIGAPFFDSPAALLSSIVFCVPWGIGLSVRRNRVQRERALSKALEAERQLAAAEANAVFEERLRIARELHDVVSHTLSVIAVQSGVARHLHTSQPERVEPALNAIENASRTALEDLRRMLGVLREAPDTEASEDEPSDGAASTQAAGRATEPAPDLASLERLASTHRDIHGPVELAITSAAHQISASLRLTIYRIVQESLTNARKHAPGSAVRIDVSATSEKVTVTVENDLADAPAGAASTEHRGFGLVGMRERVQLFGGKLDTGPTACGDFRVRAVLPTGAAQSMAAALEAR